MRSERDLALSPFDGAQMLGKRAKIYFRET